jgi:hypothetical protein
VVRSAINRRFEPIVDNGCGPSPPSLARLGTGGADRAQKIQVAASERMVLLASNADLTTDGRPLNETRLLIIRFKELPVVRRRDGDRHQLADTTTSGQLHAAIARQIDRPTERKNAQFRASFCVGKRGLLHGRPRGVVTQQ